ncbi:MAG: hypothetical protein HPY85_09930 [Anaerolineae bacterium]|nr:hypothetical protein [Anaerolineae bacterium]
MSNWNQEKSITSTVRSIIWIGGLAILFMRGTLFPEILILVVLSMIAELVVKLFISKTGGGSNPAELPDALEPLEPIDVDEGDGLNDRMQRIDPEPEPIPPQPAEDPDRLPDACPACGAPLAARDVAWLSTNKGKCGFCGTHITLEH